MSGKVFLCLLAFLLIFSFKRYSPAPASLKQARSVYARADHLFNAKNSSSASDSLCMTGFEDVILALNSLQESVLTDSLLFQAHYKLGVLCEVYKDYSRATSSYLKAMSYSKNPGEKFRLNILAGAGYYNLNNFDSASYFLQRAEESPANEGVSEDRIRLYNTLGVLYYDNGNYLQSKNYFSQSMHLMESNVLAADLSLYTKLNLATCFNKLGLYGQALDIYRNILHVKWLTDPVHMNMGRAYSGLHQYAEALASFKKVNITAVPGVLNEMAKTAIDAGLNDSAFSWLSQYQREKKFLRTNALDDGVNELYSGELEIIRGNPRPALDHLQEALITFSRNFSNRDIRKNPQVFTGSFAYYRLFEVLVQKARAWEIVYGHTGRPEDLMASYEAYQSTISLLSYIEKSYEMDDAKILLKQKSGEVYMDALTVCLRLNSIFPGAKYLEAAFLIAEKNKASVMASQIRERNMLLTSGSENNLSRQERNIKFNIARLNSKTDDRLDALSLQKINDEKSAYETELVNLRRKMESNTQFYQMKYSDDFPSLEQLQENIGPDQALISFYNTNKNVEVFVLTKSSLGHVELDSGDLVRANIQTWIQNLQSAESGRHEHMKGLLEKLYQQLMKPILDLAGTKSDWTIIPDGLFFQLPVESLPEDADGRLIIEDHAVSYAFSAKFITDYNRFSPRGGQKNPVLSFAPFSSRGADLQAEGMGHLEKLPYSKKEIEGLMGSGFTDQYATKTTFIKNGNGFPIVHLATHAVTDLENPSASYIAFFPATGLRSDDFLFLDEIYSLKMDSCQLMVISACETGKGELVRNEGVMSFARAFQYAGCPSTINTLWKADDRSTSEILKLFYVYLESGNSKSVALQKAKLDFIRNNPVNRDPSFWSHIILTGDPAALYQKKQPGYWAAFAIICSTILFFTVRKRKEKKVDAFHSQLDI
jgi:CHAT domain-containing protein/Tfp pilus assembly protein PilF